MITSAERIKRIVNKHKRDYEFQGVLDWQKLEKELLTIQKGNVIKLRKLRQIIIKYKEVCYEMKDKLEGKYNE
jgi:hypothetical protein